jgi:hypothetical protein
MKDRGKHDEDEDDQASLSALISDLSARLAEQPRLLSGATERYDYLECLLETLVKCSCENRAEVAKQRRSLDTLERILAQWLDIYRAAHPAESLQWDKLEQLRQRQLECCPPSAEPEPEPCECCHTVDCGKANVGLTSGHSISQAGAVADRHRTDCAFPPYAIPFDDFEEKESPFQPVPIGPFRGLLEPTKEQAGARNIQSGPGPGGGGNEPVAFATYTPTGKLISTSYYPPDVSGAVANSVVLMTTNYNLQISVDAGATFTLVDPTTMFSADASFGGWGCDQIITYAPSIDRFMWLMQAFPGAGGTRSANDIGQNIVRLAVASPADIVNHLADPHLAWSWFDFDSNYFSLGANVWMDYPDLSVGDNFLYYATDVRNDSLDAKGNKVNSTVGRLIARLPLTELRDGQIRNLRFTQPSSSPGAIKSQITQDTRNQVFWASHKNNTTLTVFSWDEASTGYAWRDVGVRGWPNGDSGGSLLCKAPDFADWLNLGGIGNHVLGATRRNNEIWFAWTAHSGSDGRGGFSFPWPHVQIAKINDADFSLIEQVQIWNANHAYAFPSLATNTDGEVGVSLAWGGGTTPFYGSHAVGLMGDFVVWYPEASELTLQRQVLDSAGNPVLDAAGNPVIQTRWGDYVTARRASVNGRLFGGFGYAVLKDAAVTGKADPYYILFGRSSAVNPGPPIVK